MAKKDKTYAKLIKIREAETIDLPDCALLRDTLIKSDGTEVPFELRHYQKQMVMHLLFRRRFVVGDATGLGKCLIKSSVVSTNHGLVPIGDMHDWSGMEPDTFEPVDRDWRVLVGGESLPVKNFYYGGVKPTIKVRTRYGFEVEGSRVHPLLVWRDGEHQWVELRDLREGDLLCVERRPTEFPSQEPEPMKEWLESQGPCKAQDEGLPGFALRATFESSVAMLRQLAHAFASVSPEDVKLSCGSEELARQVQVVLLRFGLVACRRAGHLKLSGPDAQGFERLFLQDQEALPEQASLYFYDPVVELEEGEAEVFDIEVDDARHWFVSNGLVSHNTAECIAAQCYMWSREPNLVPIVVTTTSAIRQWAGEFEKFTNGVRSYVVEGSPKKRTEIYEEFFSTWDPDNPSVLITNYPRLRIDYRKLKAHLGGRQYALWLDEAAAVKSPSSATHTTAKRLSEKAWRCYGVTATLIKNNLVEGFGIYSVVRPGTFSSEKAFMRNYCVTRMQPIGRGRKVPVVVGHSKQHIKLFRDKIDPYYLGRPKHAVAKELPVLTTKEVRVTMSRDQWRHYEDAVEGLLSVNETHEMVAEASLIDPDADDAAVETSHLTRLIYCQEIVNDLYLIGNEGSSPKVEMLLDMLDGELADEKVIVFTRFRKMVDRLQELLEAKGYELGIEQRGGSWEPAAPDKGLVRVTGAEGSDERDAGRRAFTETEHTNIIFLTMAGAEALNLQQARVMIFFDLPWSAGDYLQIIGRMIRIGSPHQSVYAVHLISEGPFGEKSIDNHVSATLDKKMGYIEGAIGKRLLGNPTEADDTFEFSGSSTQALYDAMVASLRDGDD